MGDEAQEHPFSHLYPQLNDQCIIKEVKQKRKRKRKAKNRDGGDASKKRKLSEEQVKMLETSFEFEQKLESNRKEKLASESGLDPRQVAVWFQNRRARWKNQRLEEEYSKLKALHHTCLLDKCTLQTQVLKLKEELEETQREIGRLREGASASTNSSSSSLTMDAMNPSVMVEDYSLVSPYYMQQGEDSCLSVALEWSLYNF